MEALSKDHQLVFQSFPAEVRRAYQESAATEAIAREDWALVAKFCQRDSLLALYEPHRAREMGQQILDSLIGSILDKEEASSAEDMVDTAAKTLASALATIVEGGPMLDEHQGPVEDVLAVAAVTLNSEILAVQTAFSEVSNGTETPILRAMHHGIGKHVIQRCADMVAKMTAASDATAAAKDCERFFKEVSEDEVMANYLAGSDGAESMDKFKAVLSEINEAAVRLASCLQTCQGPAMDAAVDAFQASLLTLAQRAQKGLSDHMAEIIPSFAENAAVDVEAAVFMTNVASHESVVALFGWGTEMAAGISADGVLKVLQHLREGKLVTQEFSAALTTASTLRDFVPGLGWVAFGAAFKQSPRRDSI